MLYSLNVLTTDEGTTQKPRSLPSMLQNGKLMSHNYSLAYSNPRRKKWRYGVGLPLFIVYKRRREGYLRVIKAKREPRVGQQRPIQDSSSTRTTCPKLNLIPVRGTRQYLDVSFSWLIGVVVHGLKSAHLRFFCEGERKDISISRANPPW